MCGAVRVNDTLAIEDRRVRSVKEVDGRESEVTAKEVLEEQQQLRADLERLLDIKLGDLKPSAGESTTSERQKPSCGPPPSAQLPAELGVDQYDVSIAKETIWPDTVLTNVHRSCGNCKEQAWEVPVDTVSHATLIAESGVILHPVVHDAMRTVRT